QSSRRRHWLSALSEAEPDTKDQHYDHSPFTATQRSGPIRPYQLHHFSRTPQSKFSGSVQLTMITKLRQPNANYSRSERGVALIAALLLLMLMSAVALLYKVNTEQNLQRTDSGNTLAYYGAEAAMEKMTADISLLYAQQAAPN